MTNGKQDQAPQEAPDTEEAPENTVEESVKDAADLEASTLEDTADEGAGSAQAVSEKNTDWKDKYLRALAELDNVRKRSERDRAQTHKYALEDILRNILPVLDALHYALAAEGDATAIREGIELAISDAHRILGEQGFLPIAALHKPFDPRWHEAVGMRPDEDHPANTVIEEERLGYKLHDRVLRPSRVHISRSPPKQEDESEGSDADV